jgi:uncharacterized DUF497 family protein
MQFEWDDDKNRLNKAKHGISFELAAQVWSDPLHWCYFDRFDDGESRMHCVGTVSAATILLVVYVDRDENGEDIIRIIGARRATAHEKRAYTKG